MAVVPQKRTKRVRLGRVRSTGTRSLTDHVAVEEPMEIRLELGGKDDAEIPVSVTMRTPGDDFELAAGFLFTEAVVKGASSVSGLRYCQNVDPQEYNVVTATLSDPGAFDPESLTRNFYVSSSCGVCGKASLESVEVLGCEPVPDGTFAIDVDRVRELPERLARAQAVFDRTGGLHAAALFDQTGTLDVVREDVGRHNAVDKVIGHALLERRLPLLEWGLLVSGRTSFEIVQKAVMARIPVVVAVGAPSSLAVDLARRFGMTLTGFTSDDGFNVYCGSTRVIGVEAGPS